MEPPKPRKKVKPPKPQGVKRLGTQAANLTNDPAFDAAMKAVEAFYTRSMVDTAPHEAEKREHLHKCIHALHDVKTALTGFMNSGKLETAMELKTEKAKNNG